MSSPTAFLLMLALPIWTLPLSAWAGHPAPDIERSAPPRTPEPGYQGYRPPDAESKEYQRLSDAIGRAPDETDARVDAGYAEIGATKKDDGVIPTELTIKTPLPVTPEISIPLGSLPTPDHPDIDPTQLKAGIAVELSGQEIKGGTRIDLNKTAADYYGDDQRVRDSALISTTENALAKFDLYYGGAMGKGINNFNVGMEGSWSMRETVTRYSQAPATEAFANEETEQANQAEWRRDKIAAEATRLGLDPTGKTTNELIKLIHARWEADPSVRQPVFNPDHELTILELVKPERVVVHGTDSLVVEDFSLNSAFTLVFWNVGAMAPGYEKVVMSVKTDGGACRLSRGVHQGGGLQRGAERYHHHRRRYLIRGQRQPGGP